MSGRPRLGPDFFSGDGKKRSIEDIGFEEDAEEDAEDDVLLIPCQPERFL